MNSVFGQLQHLFSQYSMKQRIIIIGVLIGFFSAAVALVLWANRTEYSVLYSNIDPNSAGSVVADLRNSKIPFRLENGGTTILAPSDQINELRLKYVQSGFIKDNVNGYEIFEKNNLGMTTFMQRLNFKRALEGELMRTINQFPEIKQSRVHLVIPEDKLFEGEKEGSASVVLHFMPGAHMNTNQVKGIAALVANSVEGIEPKDVVVMDDDGNVLVQDDEGNASMGNVGNQYELRQSLEQQLQKKVQDIVGGVVGKNNMVVKVSADLNFDRIERTKEEIDPDNTAILSQEKYNESSKSAIDTSNYNVQKVTSNYEISKTKETYVSNTGDIKRLTVAVLVNGRYQKNKTKDGKEAYTYIPRSEEELNQIASLVKSAVGYNEDRGDVVEVQNMKLADRQVTKDKEYFEQGIRFDFWEKIITYGLIFVGLLLALFLLKGMLKTSVAQLALPGGGTAAAESLPGSVPASSEESQALNENTSVSGQIKRPQPEEEISEDFYMKKLSPEARAKMKAKDKMTDEVIKFAEENPENTTKLIRSWLTNSES